MKEALEGEEKEFAKGETRRRREEGEEEEVKKEETKGNREEI